MSRERSGRRGPGGRHEAPEDLKKGEVPLSFRISAAEEANLERIQALRGCNRSEAARHAIDVAHDQLEGVELSQRKIVREQLLDDDQVEAVIEAVRKRSRRMADLCWFMFYTGAFTTEALRLRGSDVIPDRGKYAVVLRPRGEPRCERRVPLNLTAQRAVVTAGAKKPKSQPWKGISSKEFFQVWRDAIASLGWNRPKTPDCLHFNYADRLAASGLLTASDLKRLLGAPSDYALLKYPQRAPQKDDTSLRDAVERAFDRDT